MNRSRFVLSGSSARKLKRGGANLLAGRAIRRDLFPLVSAELGAALPLDRVPFGGFFDLLVDTLLGFWLPAWTLEPGTKVVSHTKFFFFDPGVARTLTRRLAYPPTPEEFGTLFTWPRAQRGDGSTLMPWGEFLQALWAGELIR
jgi:predicted AAA+ superfamily ATPase